MPNPLDIIWESYNTTQDSINVVRRSLGLGAARPAALQGSGFANLPDQQILGSSDRAQDQIDDQAVMFLYATFEAALRDHLAAQAPLLAAANNPTPQFGLALQRQFEKWCGRLHVDEMLSLFSPPVAQTFLDDARAIQRFRNWLAHGKRGNAVPSVNPLFAYTSLTAFLQACSLV